MRRLFTLGLFCWLFISQAWANTDEMYSSPTLNDAYVLLDIAPLEAKKLMVQYLTERRMVTTDEQSSSTMSRDGSTERVRTPNSSVEALRILAQAMFNLGNLSESERYLDQANQLVRRFQLTNQSLDLAILSAKLYWYSTHDKTNAYKRLDAVSQRLDQLHRMGAVSRRFYYSVDMLKAQIASENGDMNEAKQFYDSAKKELETLQSVQRFIEYHIKVGTHYLDHERYNAALAELLVAYWNAVDANAGAQLAKANRLLAQVFLKRQVLDRALVYASQAAEFYDHYPNAPVLAQTLKMMGDIYYQQGKYNLALVHYLNVLDHEFDDQRMDQYISLRLALAATYAQLYNYPLAEEYLTASDQLLTHVTLPYLNAQSILLHANLAYLQKHWTFAIEYGNDALQRSTVEGYHDLAKLAHSILSRAYQQIGEMDKALVHSQRYQQMVQVEQDKLNQISEDAFRQQKEFVEQTIHLVGQKQKLEQQEMQFNKLQKITVILFVVAFALFLLVLRRGYLIQTQNEEIDEINNNLFTHSRSGLSNLRMLNANLPKSLRKSSRTYEQWHVGELIHEPLSDRLRLAMVDIPFLRNMYLQYGYTSGLELEQAFGQYLKDKLDDNTRLFHFTDANLLVIEKNIDRDAPPQELFNKIERWVQEFQPSRPLNRVIRMGIADYPFLPKAYTAINEKQLLDIVLMATSASREASINEGDSHWVHFKAIDNTPAATFVVHSVRKACQIAIDQGLIKVHSSVKNEESVKKLIENA